MKYDVIIVGAGMAGLMAAHTLKGLGISFAVLEADAEIGGRAKTYCTPTGTAVDLGGHWLHGKDNPLNSLLATFKLPYQEDKADHMLVFQGGRMEKSGGEDWLENALDKEKCARLSQGKFPDCAITDLAKDEKGRRRLAAFALMWDGLTPPLVPSAREFVLDKSTPGGLQVIGGIARLVQKIAHEVGRRHIYTGTPVRKIASRNDGVSAILADGEEWQASKLFFTGSLGVIKKGKVLFEPELSPAFREHISCMEMGHMNRIALELRPEFMEERNIPHNMAIELLDGYPHFCHVRSAGSPLINLFVAGPKAAELDRMADAEALQYASRILSPVGDLAGFENYVVGDPVLSRWGINPYICGSYSACLPGGERSPPRREGNIYFCGDTFDTQYPGSMAGAARSGKAAAIHAAESLQHVSSAALLPT